jgi:hypothetical protein
MRDGSDTTARNACSFPRKPASGGTPIIESAPTKKAADTPRSHDTSPDTSPILWLPAERSTSPEIRKSIDFPTAWFTVYRSPPARKSRSEPVRAYTATGSAMNPTWPMDE